MFSRLPFSGSAYLGLCQQELQLTDFVPGQCAAQKVIPFDGHADVAVGRKTRRLPCLDGAGPHLEGDVMRRNFLQVLGKQWRLVQFHAREGVTLPRGAGAKDGPKGRDAGWAGGARGTLQGGTAPAALLGVGDATISHLQRSAGI